MSIRKQLEAEKKKIFDSREDTIGYRNGIEVAEMICSELIERSEPKAPEYMEGQIIKKFGLCPSCGKTVWNTDKFCCQCGQAITFEEKSEVN